MLLAAAALAGCGGDDPAAPRQPATPTVPAAAVPPGCEEHAPSKLVAPPAGLIPARTPVVFEVVGETGTAVRGRGFVALAPGAFVAEFRARTDVQLLFSENDGTDGEVLVAAGETQTFYKVNQVCDNGSTVVAVVTERL